MRLRCMVAVVCLVGCLSGQKRTRAEIIERYKLEPAEEGVCFSFAAEASAAEMEHDFAGNTNWTRVYRSQAALQDCREPIRREEIASRASAAGHVKAMVPPDPPAAVPEVPRWKTRTLAERAKAAPTMVQGEIEIIPEDERMPQEQRQLDKLLKRAERGRKREEELERAAVRTVAARERNAGRSRDNPVEMSAGELIAAYQENEVAADHRYAHRWVEATGPIYTIGKDFLGNIYVIVEAGIHCSTDGEQPIIQSLHPGQRVAVRGVVGGFILGSVMLRRCYVERYWQ